MRCFIVGFLIVDGSRLWEFYAGMGWLDTDEDGHHVRRGLIYPDSTRSLCANGAEAIAFHFGFWLCYSAPE